MTHRNPQWGYHGVGAGRPPELTPEERRLGLRPWERRILETIDTPEGVHLVVTVRRGLHATRLQKIRRVRGPWEAVKDNNDRAMASYRLLLKRGLITCAEPTVANEYEIMRSADPYREELTAPLQLTQMGWDMLRAIRRQAAQAEEEEEAACSSTSET